MCDRFDQEKKFSDRINVWKQLLYDDSNMYIEYHDNDH